MWLNRRTFHLLSLAALLALALPMPASAHRSQVSSRLSASAARTCSSPKDVGKVRTVSNGLRVKRKGEWKQARKGMQLVKGDVAETKAKQRAAITLCDGSTLYLNQSSSADIGSAQLATVRSGEVAARLKGSTQHRIRTPSVEVSARKGYFGTRTEKKRSVVVVAQGEVQARNKHGTVRVSQNQQTVVAQNKAPQAPTHVEAARALGWTGSVAVETWKVLTAPNLLQGPRRLALDSQGNIYVTDRGISDSRVVKLSPTGQQLAVWRLQGDHQLSWGIAIDAQNTVYVVDDGDDTLQKFTSNGQFLASFGKLGLEPGDLFDPSGLALDSAGNIYVSQAGKFPIQKFSPTGTLLATIGTQGTGPGQFDWPSDLTVDAQGNLYVTDDTQGRIQKLSPSGQSLAIWGSEGTAPGQFKLPKDVALDAAGNVWVADTYNARIQELSPTGQVVKVFGKLGLSAPGEFNGPEGIAVDGKGNVYVADNGNHRIQKLTRTP
jgi:DNA-binding beta-propeller fold protein YncE